MLKQLSIIISLILTLYSANSFSHSGGHDPVSEKEAIFIASNVVIQFVNSDAGLGFGKLKKSWKNISEDNKRIHVKADGYYIVSFNNKTEDKTLYFLLSRSGEVYDANFKGEFKGLK